MPATACQLQSGQGYRSLGDTLYELKGTVLVHVSYFLSAPTGAPIPFLGRYVVRLDKRSADPRQLSPVSANWGSDTVPWKIDRSTRKPPCLRLAAQGLPVATCFPPC